MARRLIFIGDIHGCYSEVCALLDKVGPVRGDRVIALGDVVGKGPDAAGVVALWRREQYEAVRGNAEQRMLSRSRNWLALLTRRPADRKMLGRRDLLREIASWPLFIDFPKAGAVAVHGGLLPLRTFSARKAEAQEGSMTTLRYIRKLGKEWVAVPKGEERRSDSFWTDAWKGDRIVVYGHTPRPKARKTRLTIGLDTGCVYGGKLTAAVFDGEWHLVSVPARKAYARK